MAFDPVLEPGEQVSADIRLVISDNRQESRRQELRLVLTNRAAYWPAPKFGLFDSVTTKRMPLSEVVSVTSRAEWYLGNLIVGSLMLIGGLIVMTFGGMVSTQDWACVGGGLVLILLGLAIAAHGGWRRTLVIASEQIKFSWVEPRAFREEFQARVSAVFEEVRIWAQSNRLRLEE